MEDRLMVNTSYQRKSKEQQTLYQLNSIEDLLNTPIQ